jgi:hypothetical protein
MPDDPKMAAKKLFHICSEEQWLNRICFPKAQAIIPVIRPVALAKSGRPCYYAHVVEKRSFASIFWLMISECYTIRRLELSFTILKKNTW